MLSRLYGTPIDVLHVDDRILVVSGTGWSKPTPIATMLEYDFMRTAFVAGGLVAHRRGAVGYFLVLRNLVFAGHALSHVGFAGATGSVLLGPSPLWGLLAFTLVAAIAMGLLGDRLRGRDVAVGIMLSLALGLACCSSICTRLMPRRRPRSCSATCWA